VAIVALDEVFPILIDKLKRVDGPELGCMRIDLIDQP
jgi:hypothetical protein